jgi:diguanylate cyclase (GGDEF)-like protein
MNTTEMTTENKAKLLIVDDVPGNIKLLSEVLRDDYTILVATSGPDALETVTSESVDLILLDVVMPTMDGYDVCRALKTNAATAHIPVIFVTAQNDAVDEEKGLALGAIDYITKPISPPIVRARVRNHVTAKLQKDALERLSVIDGLTGIANRRQFDRFIEQEWRRAVRNSLGLSIILIDIDYFKKFNDHFGHGGGDECLVRVAQTLQDTVMRATDLVARYGGEEFVVVLPQSEHTGVTLIAEKLRRNVAALNIAHPQSEVTDHVTISLGCASMTPPRGLTWHPLLEAADRMLYAAKAQGRNQVQSTFM